MLSFLICWLVGHDAYRVPRTIYVFCKRCTAGGRIG